MGQTDLSGVTTDEMKSRFDSLLNDLDSFLLELTPLARKVAITREEIELLRDELVKRGELVDVKKSAV